VLSPIVNDVAALNFIKEPNIDKASNERAFIPAPIPGKLNVFGGHA
jgi:hypothetical protein